MLFNSLSFLVFLPIVFTIYWWVNKKDPQVQSILLLFSTALDYFYGIKMAEANKQANIERL
jgi:alginate O-acetyltransferase complex protein AlgI